MDSTIIASGTWTEGSGAEAVVRSFTVSVPDGGSLNSTPLPDIIRISVSVTWTIGDQQKGSYVYTDLSNWRGR
jgi:hypothetical protein